jgi:taurine dioxygenase
MSALGTTAAREPARPAGTPLTLRPLSPALGAEIVGLDLRQPLDAATKAQVIEAWHDNLVLLFRDQVLDEEDQVRFCRIFGPLQERRRPKDKIPEKNLKYPDEVMLVSNIRENGQLIGSLPDGEMQFHSDQCYVEVPPNGTFLYAMEIPSQGGDTLFLNMYKAYEALPADIKAKIDGKRAMNVYFYGSTTRENNEVDFREHPHYVQPLVRTHNATGRKALYANRLMTWSIEGMAPAESAALLNDLFDHMEQPQFIYAHKWRVGDLVLWDNRCTLHARTDFSDQERRMLRRVVVAGERAY